MRGCSRFRKRSPRWRAPPSKRSTAPPRVEELEKLRVTYLGKQSKIMLLSKELGKVPAELRPAFGEAVNAGKKRLQEALDRAQGCRWARRAAAPRARSM